MNTNITQKYIFLTIIICGLIFIIMPLQPKTFIQKPTRVVSVDIREILDTFISQTQSKSLNPEQVNHDVDEFSNKLSQFIKDKAEQDNIIIVTKQAVLAGAEDYTPKIKQELFKEAR